MRELNSRDYEKLILKSIDLFLHKDKDLLGINDSITQLHEIAISHRIALYIEALLVKYNFFHRSKFHIAVDIEYNKHGEDPKHRDNGAEMRPDIVVHSRGTDECNLIAIEIKKQSHDMRSKNDARKKIDELCLCTTSGGRFGYKWGCVLEASNTDVKIIYKTL